MRRRKRRNTVAAPVVVLLALVAVAVWWVWRSGGQAGPTNGNGAAASALPTQLDTGVPEAILGDQPVTFTDDEVLEPVGPEASSETYEPEPIAADTATVDQAVPEPPAATQPAADPTPPAAEQFSSNPRINASLERYHEGKIIAARQELNRMLAISRDESEQAELRVHLSEIAAATIFSKQHVPGDPLIEYYTIESGDRLISIGREFKVPHEVVMMINGISDATRIRAGDKIKVPRGPFNVTIDASQFRMDVYLQDLYVRSFPVGLGADQGTPKGTWQVKERLANPTYYPPASAADKRIIAPDDPANPLGERWIGLEGVGGDAVGRFGYGIHGTIDPSSIGRAVSMGCVRMHNDDVAYLYRLLLPGQSMVTTKP